MRKHRALRRASYSCSEDAGGSHHSFCSGRLPGKRGRREHHLQARRAARERQRPLVLLDRPSLGRSALCQECWPQPGLVQLTVRPAQLRSERLHIRAPRELPREWWTWTTPPQRRTAPDLDRPLSLPPTTSTVSPRRSSAPRRAWLDRIKGRLERGWNVFVFDGRGQQSLLFERKIPFRHDWEVVLTPVVDLLVAWPDVDAEALLAYGISQGGYGLPRALAFEHRFRRCCRRTRPSSRRPPQSVSGYSQRTHPTNGRPHASEIRRRRRRF